VAVIDALGVSSAVGVDGAVAVCVGVSVAVVALGLGVGVTSENGAENSDVLLLMSVFVAVTFGPLSGPSNVQLPSLVNTEASKTRPCPSESEKISTAHGAHAVPCSGSLPTIVGGARLSFAFCTSRMPPSSFA